MSSRELANLHERWTAYQDLPELTSHWYWRPGWRADRQFYTWHLTFEHQPELHHVVTNLQRQLALPGLDLVPLDGLHLTMQGLGFTDEVTDHGLRTIVAEAQRRCAGIPPLELSLGPVDPDAEGIGLLVRPWDRVEQLRAAIRDAIGSVWQTVPEAAEGFRPHVTIAYSGSQTPTGPVRDRLNALRHQPPARVIIRQATLIALRRERRTYQWTTVAVASLTG
ncbi:2'-5' RNA ligase family protein [Micromonospora endolithica]|uniref:2'-5' RNA ligase family protein n=1 Tax=Micromonospora endolithica TaxID=230091 RepID=A0A3A9ZQ79_9ACTN|nr:2'-5' RNA ligase family protein [Micromonospora endolithica]RKN50428.1 2'-5' RNA ligase family protein [Micromonospora endolithica]TWJ20885.1 2'-5' RNA ligase [Micromonospora endolithica]